MKTTDDEGSSRAVGRGLFRWRRWLKPFISHRNSPEAIAGGFALGFAVAFTPTLGGQILLAYFLATLLRLSRSAALIPIWVTTPFTAAPIYAFTYMIGNLFTGGPSVGTVRRRLEAVLSTAAEYDALDIGPRFRAAMNLGTDIFVPMLLGGILVGGFCAALAYPTMLFVVRRLRQRREDRKQHRKHFRLRRRDPLSS